jgi:hypothetical protein
MSGDYDLFRHGSVGYPLPAALTNPLVQDADPPLAAALDFFSSQLDKFIGARLKAQAAPYGIVINHAVGKTLALEPTRDILAENFVFPLLCLWRVSEVDTEITFGWDSDAGVWTFAYVLPLMPAAAKVAVTPILRSVGRVIAHATRQGFDPDYQSGKLVWNVAGVQQIVLKELRYGNVDAIDQEAPAYKAIMGTFEVRERDMYATGDLEPFTGADVSVDVRANDGTTAADVVTAATFPQPTITSISPNSGSKDGGITVTVTGTGYRVGTPTKLALDGVQCTAVNVLSSTQLQAVTGAHAAYPTFIADAVVTNADGLSARKPAAFTFT